MFFQFKKYRKQVIFLADTSILWIVSGVLYLLLPKDNIIPQFNVLLLLPQLILLIICSTITHSFFKTYDSLWRYAESKEYLSLLLGGIIGFTGFLILNCMIFEFALPVLYFLADYSLSLLFMLLMRFYYRRIRVRNYQRNYQGRIPIAIIGAGTAGVRLMDEIKNDPNSRYCTYCFIDDSIEKIGKRIHNVEIKGPIKDIDLLLQDTPVREIILAIPSITAEKRNEILKLSSLLKCRVKVLPDILCLMQKEDMPLSSSIREIKIEELLGREPVTFDTTQINNFIKGKVVMVTGGGGSIGSELCRQIAKGQPGTLIILDNYENNAYDIQQELKFIYQEELNIKVEIVSVREEEKVDLIFKRYRPNIVFHAAAHKHVPLMEDCPEEAVKNNIFGTYNVVQASDRYGVDKFVLISTDKAVNPTNIMGATKRFCEIILQSMMKTSKTEYVSVRFGNVLGSNGSVVPLFKRQIEQGGPVTITDKRVIRFFMTIPEAAQLVLQAGAMANRTEVYVLDMGQPVKIIDLAEKLIQLSGYEPYTEIQIVETGLRPGEKLYEEILMAGEELMETSNNKIFIERQKEISQEELNSKLEILKEALATGSCSEIKKAMKQVVPTYRVPKEVNANVDKSLESTDEIQGRHQFVENNGG